MGTDHCLYVIQMEQRRPPATPYWAVFVNDKGKLNVRQVHAWVPQVCEAPGHTTCKVYELGFIGSHVGGLFYGIAEDDPQFLGYSRTNKPDPAEYKDAIDYYLKQLRRKV